MMLSYMQRMEKLIYMYIIIILLCDIYIMWKVSIHVAIVIHCCRGAA